MNDKTAAPFVDGDRPIRTTPRTVVMIVAALIAGACSWVLLRAQVEQQAKDISAAHRRIDSIDDKLDAQRSILLEIRADQKAQARRTP